MWQDKVAKLPFDFAFLGRDGGKDCPILQYVCDGWAYHYLFFFSDTTETYCPGCDR